MIVARLTLIAVFMFGIIVAYDENSSIFGVVSYAVGRASAPRSARSPCAPCIGAAPTCRVRWPA